MNKNVFENKPDILVVDDTPEYLETYFELLIEKGCNVRIAKNAEAALEEIQRRLPELVLLDVVMPYMNGYELCKLIKVKNEFENIPVIFITSNNDVNSIIQGFKAGGQDYLTKPLNELEFITKIENHLKLKYLSDLSVQQVIGKKEINDNWKSGKMIFDSLFDKFNISAFDVLENTADGIVLTDFEGKILYLNRYSEEIIDWDRKEVIGKNYDDVFRLYEEDLRKRVESPVGKVIKTGMPADLTKNTVMLTKKDESIFLSASYSIIQGYDGNPKGIASVFRDVSKLRKKEIEVEENERKFRALFNNTSDALLVTEADEDNLLGKIIEANQAACQMAGCTREVLLNMKVIDLERKFNIILDKQLMTESIKEMLIFGESKVTKNYSGIKNGNNLFLEISTHYFRLNNQNLAISIIHDVTSFRIAEEQTLKAMQMAEEANKTKSMFLANMSHEIRTPLNGIIGMSDLMLRVKMTPEEQKESTKTIIACSQNLLHLLNNILDFSKMEAEKVEINNSMLNLKEVIEESIDIYQLKAKDKGLVFIMDIQEGTEKLWFGDKVKLQQILNNLINNAVKFTLEGSIIVSVNKLKNNGEDCELQFTISDTGLGISEKDIDKLFIAFSQVDGSYTRQFGGTGLGLSISKKLVELMGGRIWVESTVGIGSRFNFTLKLRKADEDEKYYQKNQKYLSVLRNAGLKEKKILLVEDELINQKVFLRIANLCNFEVEVANNGLEAIDLIKKNSYDLIIMDIKMPVMDGIEATKKIRTIEEIKGKYTPVVAVTAHALEGDHEKFISLGMDDYLTKPYNIDELLTVISGKTNFGEDVSDDIAFSKLVLEGSAKSKAIKSVKLLSDEVKGYCEKLQTAIIEKDAQNAEKYSHIIKEMASHCGCNDVKLAAFGVEMQVRKKNFIDAHSLFIDLISRINFHTNTKKL